MTKEEQAFKKALENGSLLEAAVAQFNQERSRENLIAVLAILRNSWVWVPCTAVASEVDQSQLEEMINRAGDGPEQLNGKSFVAKGETRLIPDILQNAGELYFPMFSTAEAMGEYGNSFSKVQKHILEVIRLATNSDRELVGIVLNAFSEPFILDRKLWGVVEGLKTDR